MGIFGGMEEEEEEDEEDQIALAAARPALNRAQPGTQPDGGNESPSRRPLHHQQWGIAGSGLGNRPVYPGYEFVDVDGLSGSFSGARRRQGWHPIPKARGRAVQVPGDGPGWRRG
jgi:hypothetical protein